MMDSVRVTCANNEIVIDKKKWIKCQVHAERANASTRKRVTFVTARSGRPDHDASIR